MNRPIQVIVTIFLLFLIFIFYLSTSVDTQDVEVGFSPGRVAKDIVLMAIKEAKTSIDIAIYSFTSKQIALALIKAQQKGINIRVVVDNKSNSRKYTAVTYLTNHCVPVKFNNKYIIMHNKFMIIDSHSIETGSFNYTKNAASHNAENVIYLRNRPDITKKYTQEFNRLWNEAIYKKPIC
ncbi:phospholipase D family protein [Candidatus Fukatsuia anoeciicola]|uniref:phospholipase D family nuclease n=1 Tax=Candidatus Fukatsuia anoeciicola TaxID=2994492 RepID=UPI003463FDB9